MVSFSATGNALSGPIPEGIKSWTKLETLNLKANLFKGPVPEFLASLPKLKSLDLSENDGLTGALPVGFSTLQQCALPKNVCSNGTVPAVCPAVRAC
jgi:Leucine-rich repeat (LRR) protein